MPTWRNTEGRYWLRTPDHLAANNRRPEPGERQWNIDFESDTGEKWRLHVGPETRDLILRMLAEDQAKVYGGRRSAT